LGSILQAVDQKKDGAQLIPRYSKLVDEAAKGVPHLIDALEKASISPEATCVGMIRFATMIAQKGKWSAELAAALMATALVEVYGVAGVRALESVMNRAKVIANALDTKKKEPN
jgi:hypothetical protein